MFNRKFDHDQEERDLYLDFLLEDCYIDPKQNIEYPPIAISFGEHSYETKEGLVTYPTPIGTYGNFSFIQAPPKHKKTFLVTLLSAAYLGGGSERFTGKLKGHRNERCIYHFDTEQGSFHAQKVFKRVLDMCDMEDQCYRTFGLRKCTPKERLELIDFALRTKTDLGLVIIDGIADLVNDVNNIEECNGVVQKIMEWTQVHDIHIITVIHTNWNSNKPTGHLGSAMEKKAETQIQLEKNENNPTIINVKCKASRGRSFEDFSFFVNKAGLPEIADHDIEVLDLINGNKIRNTNQARTTPIGKGELRR